MRYSHSEKIGKTLFEAFKKYKAKKIMYFNVKVSTYEKGKKQKEEIHKSSSKREGIIVGFRKDILIMAVIKGQKGFNHKSKDKEDKIFFKKKNRKGFIYVDLLDIEI